MRGATACSISQGWSTSNFNPRAPCGARPLSCSLASQAVIFQSTRPMRGATLKYAIPALAIGISIHAPHAGRDILPPSAIWSFPRNFNPRAPCGARLHEVSKYVIPHVFQSTRPMRGATNVTLFAPCATIYFNPRAPCGARLLLASPVLSSLPISIHAPHAGRDSSRRRRCRRLRDFNPRAPCGARRKEIDMQKINLKFQSTRPMRGATRGTRSCDSPSAISIHAPHAGRDYSEA